MDTDALIRGYLEGDAASIAKVRTWVAGSIAGFRHRLGADFEDTVQEVLIELMRVFAAGTFAGTGPLEAFVSRIARRRSIDRLRRQGQARWVDLESLSPWLDDPDALGRLRSVENLRGLLRLWNAMPAACRELWRLLSQGYDYREMGTLLGVAPGTLRVRVKRCREKAHAHREKHAPRVAFRDAAPRDIGTDVTPPASATTDPEESLS